MKSTDSFSILIYPKQGKSKSNIQKLYSKITFNSKSTSFSLKRSIDIEIWDARKSKMKGNSFEANKVNTYIEQIRAEIFEAYDFLRKENKVITANAIKLKFLNVDEDKQTLLGLVTYHYKLAESTLRPGTLKNYKTTEKYIIQFLNEVIKVEDIYLDQLSYSFITKFENYLRLLEPIDHQKKTGNNTIMKHIQRIRKIINVGVRLEWIKIDPFKEFKSKFDAKVRDYLSQIEMDVVRDKQITISRLEYIRDLFIFSCYTGLSYIDVMNLTPLDISRGIDGHKWIFTERCKTNVPVKVPILNIAQEIIDTYIDDPRSLHRGTVFPKISNQKLNAYLKELADICGIHKNLTFHVARHTFATTIALSNGVPIETVSKMLGHTKITTTQIYAKVLEHKISDDMSILRNKLEHTNQQKRITG